MVHFFDDYNNDRDLSGCSDRGYWQKDSESTAEHMVCWTSV